jgi:glycosyltransferase involved in cell wall biosynthesis
VTTKPPAVELSVVVPVYGCAACLDELYTRTTAVLETDARGHELVFVDDASPDGAARVLAGLAARDRRVTVLALPENRGQPAAIAAGLARARGRWAAVMDGDLQDPPETVPRLLAVARQGVDIVVARRRAHPQPRWRRWAGRAFAALVRARHGSRLAGTHSLFSVLSQRAVAGYLRREERLVTYLPVLETLGLPIASVDYDRSVRASGTSAYDLGRLLRRAWRVLTARPIARAVRHDPSADGTRCGTPGPRQLPSPSPAPPVQNRREGRPDCPA